MKIIQKLNARNADMYNASPVTIGFLGDSVTHGCFDVYVKNDGSIETWFEPHNSYSACIRKILAMFYPRAQVNIINGGISGDNARRGSQRLERDVLKHTPDLVVVSYGLNDSGGGEAGLEGYRDSLRTIFRQVKESGAECIFLTENMMNTYVSPHLKDEVLRGCAESTARTQNSGMLERYFDAAKAVAAEEDVTVCDCYSKWKALHEGGVDITDLLANKINHPSHEMTWLFAYSLVETMFL